MKIKSNAKKLTKDIVLAEKTANIQQKITVKNTVQEVMLRCCEIEFEKNVNARYAKNKNLNIQTSNQNILYQKGNANETRMQALISNANKLSSLSHQFIVFDRELVLIIRNWLENLPETKYGNMKQDVTEIKKMFPIIEKEWLAIDGNSYCSIVKQIYIERNKNKNNKANTPLTYWAKYYKAKQSRGFAYTAECLSSDDYQRDIQIVELIGMILEKNLKTWEPGNIDAFYKKLTRIMFYVVEKHNKQDTLYKTFNYFQAIKYLFMPNISTSGKTQRFNHSRRMDYYTFTALFGQNEELNNTTYNVKLFSDVINFVLSKKLERIQYNTAKDILFILHGMMYKYQEDSMKYVPEGFSARDRLTKAVSFCKEDTMFAAKLKQAICNEELDIIADEANALSTWMCDKYQKYIQETTASIFSVRNLERNKYETMYEDIISGKMEKEAFIKMLLMRDYIEGNE